MKLGYNMNGFAHHRLEDALRILADQGYEGVGLTLDHHHLDPFAADWQKQAEAVRKLLDKLKLTCVVETGARFLLDPWKKHQPTLLSAKAEERQRRLDFLKRCGAIAEIVGSPLLSFWSGASLDDEKPEVLLPRLVDGVRELLDDVRPRNLRLAFEPEPGMFIARLSDFADLHAAVAAIDFGLTVDLGHLFCQMEEPIPKKLAEWRRWIWHLHIEDMCRGLHDHLFFGDGQMDFPPLLRALKEIDYKGEVHVELSRHSHNAVHVAGESRAFLIAAGFAD